MLRYGISSISQNNCARHAIGSKPAFSRLWNDQKCRKALHTTSMDIKSTHSGINLRFISTSAVAYSGHNKWSKIRHNKAIQDSKRSGLYIRLAKDIGIAVQTGGSPNPDVNPALALAIKKAKSGGLPKANLDRALAKAASGGSELIGQDILYELMTADKVGLLVHCVTENPARSKQGLNKILKDRNVRFTPTSFMFSKRAVVRLVLPSSELENKMEAIMDAAIELGAEDVVSIEDEEGTDEEGTSGANQSKEDAAREVEVEVLAPPELLSVMTTTLSRPPHSYKLSESELQWRPLDPDVARADAEALSEERREDLARLINDLEEYSECVGVWSSID